MISFIYKKVDLKKSFDVFQENIIDYAIKELDNTKYVIMLIQTLVDTKSSLGANNEPNEPTLYEERSEAKKAILDTRVRQ